MIKIYNSDAIGNDITSPIAATRFLTKNDDSRTKPLRNSHSDCGWTYSITFGVPQTTSTDRTNSACTHT